MERKKTESDRRAEAEYLKEELAKLLNDDEDNPIITCNVTKELFIEMAFCFIAKHGG